MTTIAFVAICLFAIWIYFLPTFFAHKRNAVGKGMIFVINLCFGWTLIGWLVALFMAGTATSRA